MGKTCKGTTTCGNCQPLTGPSFIPGLGDWPTDIESCSAVRGFGEAGRCANTTIILCPNGDVDCRNDDGTGKGVLGEDYCVVPCGSCDIATCCTYMLDRFPTADTTPVTGQFPFVPVNPAPSP